MGENVLVRKDLAPIFIITINRPSSMNAVDKATAHSLYKSFREFDDDDAFSVAILSGSGKAFCAGADLKAMLKYGARDTAGGNPLHSEMDKIGPMGPSRLQITKPVIAAISGPCVAGGLELACWCDLRVADETALFGVRCRLRGVPLIDGGTVRLPKLIGLSRASDLILTGREVTASEAHEIGLVNYLVPSNSLEKAIEIARLLASHPQRCMRNDRLSMLKGAYGNEEHKLMEEEFKLGMDTLNDAGFGKEVDSFVTKSRM